MDLIPQFVARYRKEFDFYEQACRMAAQILDSNLQSAGIRAIVTSRAKSPGRLEAKLRQRAAKKNYETLEDIYDDIVDLAGVRVALYFPAERDEVGRITTSAFVLVAPPKVFPDGTTPPYAKRFTGYGATHYRVRLPEKSLNESQKRYAEARIEIQVASVLMHAWSEVEHDLVYKPLQGQLSDDEYAILDELNGLVLTGEIALERLQRAGELRLSAADREYTNHYDLAASLIELAREKLAGLNIHGAAIGRVDLLFQLLQHLALNNRERLVGYVSALHSDFERRPLAEQVIDQVLAEDPTRYSIFETIRAFDVPSYEVGTTDISRTSKSDAIGEFMSLWIDYENFLRSYAGKQGISSNVVPNFRVLSSMETLPAESRELADRLRRFRNQLVHGFEVPDAESIRAAANDLRTLMARIREATQPPKKPPKRKRKPPTT